MSESHYGVPPPDEHPTTVFVVIPTFNRWSLTKACLDCLARQTWPMIRVIVSDGGSIDGTRERLAREHPEATVVYDGRERWWAGSTALGIEHALQVGRDGDFILLLNNDTEIPPDYVATLVAASRRENAAVTEVEIDIAEIVEEFPKLITAIDTPISDIAAHGYYAVSRAARAAGIPVLLSGLGGDEVFWGYDWVRAAAALAPAQPVRPSFWQRLFGRQAPPARTDSIFTGHEELTRTEALARRLAPARVPRDHWLEATRTPATGSRDVAVSAALNNSWLIANCLELADRLSMAWSIEMRVPFLDIDLIEGVTALRQGGLGDHAWPHKGLLLNALGHLLPAEITERRKQGFTPPVQDWMGALDKRWSERATRDSAAARAGLLDGAEQARLWPDLPISMRHKLLVLYAWARGVLQAA